MATAVNGLHRRSPELAPKVHADENVCTCGRRLHRRVGDHRDAVAAGRLSPMQRRSPVLSAPDDSFESRQLVRIATDGDDLGTAGSEHSAHQLAQFAGTVTSSRKRRQPSESHRAFTVQGSANSRVASCKNLSCRYSSLINNNKFANSGRGSQISKGLVAVVPVG